MKLLQLLDCEPGIPLAPGDRHPLDEEKVQQLVERLKLARDQHGREDAYEHSGLPAVVLNADRELVNGRHRDEAAGRADVPVKARVFQFDDHVELQEQIILENLSRTHLTPQQERADLAALVKLKVLRGELASHDAEHAQPAHVGRQRHVNPEREAIRSVASETGRSERTVERAVKADREPVVERVAPKPPTMDERMVEAHTLLGKACALLEPLRREIEALKDDWDRKDGRWALLGSVAQASKTAETAATYISQARAYHEDMERGRHGRTTKERPIGAFDVAKGRDAYEAAQRPARVMDAEQLAHEQQQRVAAKIRERDELLESQAIAAAGPKKGLGGKKLRIEVVAPELPPPLSPEEEVAVFEAADAAGVGPGEKGRW